MGFNYAAFALPPVPLTGAGLDKTRVANARVYRVARAKTARVRADPDAAAGAVQAAAEGAAVVAEGTSSLDSAIGILCLFLTVYVTGGVIFLTAKNYQWKQRKKDADARLAAGIDFRTVTNNWNPILLRPEAQTLAALGQGKKPPSQSKSSASTLPMNREMRRQAKKMEKRKKKAPESS